MPPSQKPSVEDSLRSQGYAPVSANEKGERFSRVAYILPEGLRQLLRSKFKGTAPDVVVVDDAKANRQFGIIKSNDTIETYYALTEKGDLQELGTVRRSVRARLWACVFGKRWDAKSRNNIFGKQ